MKSDPDKPSTSAIVPLPPGDAAVPLGFMVALGVLFFSGLLYLDRNAGGFDPLVYEPYRSRDLLVSLHPKKTVDPLMELGQKTYAATCAPCHQTSGLGAAGQAPPLAGSEWVLGEGPNRVIRVVLAGLQGPITVKGQPFNGAMLAWRDTLNDEQIAAAVTFIRRNPDWGHNASAVTPEQVKALREEVKGRVTQFTEAEVMATSEK